MTETSAPGTTLGLDSTTADPDSTTSSEPQCVSGTWTGVYTYDFETVTFADCGDGPGGNWWFENGPDGHCGPVVLTVEGTLCGPGAYGHLGYYDYQLSGTVVGDACLPGQCDGEPTECAPFDELCAYQPSIDCSLSEQDCDEGGKCVPSSQSGHAPWDETRCQAIAVEPAGPGEPCMLFGTEDDCEAGWWCIGDEPLATMGVCMELCTTESPCTVGECHPCSGSEMLEFGVCVTPECMDAPDCPGYC